MRVVILMMFKNEPELLEPWIRYHSALVGKKNLFLFDNGSDEGKTLSIVARLRETGYKIYSQFSKPEHFVGKGDIFSRAIKRLDEVDPADFYFPLDCDEFLAAANGGQPDMRSASIKAELMRHVNSTRPLRILAGLDNNPLQKGAFRWAHGQVKLFFAQKACDFLDSGFHNGRSVSGETPLTTSIIYVHFHFRPYEQMVVHARMKLQPFSDDFSPEALENRVRSQSESWHCASDLLKSRDEYESPFRSGADLHFTQIEDGFARRGLTMPFSSSSPRQWRVVRGDTVSPSGSTS